MPGEAQAKTAPRSGAPFGCSKSSCNPPAFFRVPNLCVFSARSAPLRFAFSLVAAIPLQVIRGCFFLFQALLLTKGLNQYRLGIKDEFESEGYIVEEAGGGQQGLARAMQWNPDLIILDIMLPLLDGWEVCRRLRAGGHPAPIIMLTVKDKEIDRVLGLELGADDYVTKPFSLRELIARAKAILRRCAAVQGDPGSYSFGGVQLDFKRYEARKNKRKLDLTPLEFHILKLLIRRKGEVLSRDAILDEIWGKDNVSVTLRTVDSHIANIRKKIEEDASNPRHIISVRAVGYKFQD